MGGNALYVVMMEPAAPNAEYELFAMMQKTMTPTSSAGAGNRGHVEALRGGVRRRPEQAEPDAVGSRRRQTVGAGHGQGRGALCPLPLYTFQNFRLIPA